MVAGTVEPAYDVGGDTFDYAAQPEALTVSVTDAVGHGQDVIAHRAGDLADDVTVVCLDWRGPAS
jgi:hypothetical protein